MKERMISLDVFRGLTVGLMILVNNPGSWSHIYPPLRHAHWNGWTPTDLVFPFFLFIVGVAMALSFGKRVEAGADVNALKKKVWSRGAIIIGLGLFLNGFPFNIPLNAQMAADFEFLDIFRRFQTIRYVGVLQRIGLAYLIGGLIVLYLPKNRDRIIAAGILVLIYEFFMRVPLVNGWGGGSFELQDNFVRYIDILLFGEAHIYGGTGIPFDPEGLLSTLPAAVTLLSGFWLGEYLRRPIDHQEKLTNLSVVGIILFFAGSLLSLLEPINKQLWTVSYVITMDGLAIMMIVLSSYLIDVKKLNFWIKPAIVFGSNALVVFVGSGIIGRLMYMLQTTSEDGTIISIKQAMYDGFYVPLAGELNGSLLFALTNILFWLAILWYLYSKKIFVKI
ncbi:MAG: heparan-alpha-glucosaminide N-acetyltransferase domain-containing protein [Candidatus Marinimicrobia bacterium]|nr:heparan-alpha-glucosaminide N-acetyltransferase domain-containing protein [Candidatus Neomarinimicrobiota bacterium]